MTKANQSPLITVIVPSYNYGHLIGETLSNLQSQTFENWECIVVDDGSTDDTRKTVQEWCKKDKRFIYLHQKNAGLSAARNTGIRSSSGNYIQLLDSDDMLEPGKLAHQISIFNLNADAEIVYGEVRDFTSENPTARYFTIDCGDMPWMPCSSSLDQQKLISDLLDGNIFPVNAPLIKKSVFQRIGFFDTKLNSVEDWDYWCRCALAGIYFVYDDSPDSHALVRTHEGSMSRNTITMKEASLRVREKISGLLKKLPDKKMKPAFMKTNQQQRAFLMKSLSQLYLSKGEKWKCIEKLFQFAVIRQEYRFFLKSLLGIFSGKKELPFS